MNKNQKEILQAFLDAEKKELKQLEAIYNKALTDIDDRLANLLGRADADMAHVIYQVEYQKALKTQISGILDDLHSKEFQNITEYMNECYNNGYIGAMYDIAKQGIPIISPIDQKKVVQALKIDSKISKGLYTRLGEDVTTLKKRIASSVSRGIAAGQSYKEIARNIQGISNIGFNRAMRIARTEGGRIQSEAAFHAQHDAIDAGADVVKQWDASMDGKTRDTHRALDGQIREIDEPFEADGKKAMYPHGFGIASEDINCRCALLQRARWALDEEELQTLKDRAERFGLDKTKDFIEYKAKYLNTIKALEGIDTDDVLSLFNKSNQVDPELAAVAKTIKANWGLNVTDLEDLSLDVLDLVTYELDDYYSVFGNLNAIGHLKGIGALPEEIDAYAGFDPESKYIFLRRKMNNDMLRMMTKDAIINNKMGIWSTKDTMHSVRHELGHSVAEMLFDPYDNEHTAAVKQLRLNMLKELDITDWDAVMWSKDDVDKAKRLAAGKKISFYALCDDDEFVAESIAEYMAGNPRETAKTVVNLLLKNKRGV